MAILALIGFETGDLSELDSSGEILETTVVRTGSYALRHNLAGNSIFSLKSGGGAEKWVRFYFRIDDDTFTNASADFFEARASGGGVIWRLQINTTENVILQYAGGSSGTSTATLSVNTWYRIEVRYKEDSGATDGELQLWIDGNSEVLHTGETVNTEWVDVDINTSSTGPSNSYYDDILVTDNGLPGAGGIVALLPNGDDSTRDDWEDQAAGATTWDKVDEVPVSTTDYAISPASGAGAQEQEWDLGTTTVGTINAVKVIANARKTAGGGSTEVEIPTSILSSTNLSGAVTDIDDDPDSPDGLWLTVPSPTNNKATDVRVDFATPSTGSLDGSTNAQEFRAQVRHTGESTNPDARIELWESGSLVRAGSNTTVTSSTGQVIAFTWTKSELASQDGANVEMKVVGTPGGGNPGNRASVEVGAVEWNAAIASATTHKLAANNANASSRSLSADLGLTETDTWYEYFPTGTVIPSSQGDIDAYRIGGEASASGDPKMRINAAYLMVDFGPAPPFQPNDRWHRIHSGLLAQ